MKRFFVALAFLAALSITGFAQAEQQVVDPTVPGLRPVEGQKTDTGVSLDSGVCRVTYFAMDGLSQALRVEVSCWKDASIYADWAAKRPNSQPIKKVEFTANNGDYAALLGANANLFSAFIGKIETVLLQNPKLAEVLRTNRQE